MIYFNASFLFQKKKRKREFKENNTFKWNISFLRFHLKKWIKGTNSLYS